VLPEEHRPKVFSTKTPHSVGTFLVDGSVAGSWRYTNGRIETTAYEPMTRSVERALIAEAARLADFHR
jgi:hypothetical protein